MNTTYRTLETRMARNMAGPLGGLPDVGSALQAYNIVRARHNLSDMAKSGVGGLLVMSDVDANAKLEYGDGLPNVSLALAPHSLGGYDVCPFAGLCREGCVAFAGNGKYPKVLASRTARKEFMAVAPGAFLSLLVHDLDKLGGRYPQGFAARLNSFSDIRWERVMPSWFWDRYSDVTFYDYTKHSLRSRPVSTLPANYSLTFSKSEKTRKGEARANIDAGRNVAVVLSIRGGKVRTTGEKRPIPATFDGVPMVDGDESDRRYDDPSGVVVGLRRKGSLGADSPFIAHSL